VTAAGGGGISTVYKPGRLLRGIEAVIDKDLCSELLAELDAVFFIMATDADEVYIDWGKPINGQSVPPIQTPGVPVAFRRPDGAESHAACDFAEVTGKRAGRQMAAHEDIKDSPGYSHKLNR